MARERKTICFKENVYKKINEERGQKSFSEHVNNVFEERYHLKKPEKKKKKATTIKKI